MSNALHDYAKLFERYAANNGGTGAILAGEDCLSLANEMRMDADAIDAENAKLRGERDHWHVEQVHAYGNWEDAYKLASELEAENAELRQQLADVTESMGRVEERRAKTFEVGKRWMAKAARFESENTKLRELVRELWTYAEQELLCDENCSYGAVCDWRDCVFERRMRELGVEVD